MTVTKTFIDPLCTQFSQQFSHQDFKTIITLKYGGLQTKVTSL